VATVRAHIDASPEDVWAVLAEGWFYSNWVVGTSHVRAVEKQWPALGAKLFHASGLWPVVARDETVVEEVDAPRRLVLTARGRPLGEARVSLELVSGSGGTDVTMVETPVSGPGKWLHNPLTELGLARRNVESLARLSALAERRTHPAD
jgi:uncharacterized protein YndB with AHSA1/START domain